MDPINAPKEVSPPETAAQSAARSGLRETFVYATIALVAVALGAGLKLHMELEAPLAAAFALPVALVLLLAHQNHSRGRVIAALRTELVELRRSDGHLHRVMREPQPGMQTRTSAKIPAANVSLSSGNTRGPEQAGPGLAASAQASPPRSPGIAQSAPAQLGTPRTDRPSCNRTNAPSAS